MNSALKITAGIVAFLLLAVASLVIWWVAGDKSEWRDYLARLASEKLGRELTIAGPVAPSFSITRGLTIRVEQLTLANAETFQPREMLTVPELTVAVDLRALFSNNIHITGLAINGATLNLESRGAIKNWDFKKQEKTQPADEESPAVKTRDGKTVAFAADDVTAENLLITMKSDGRAKQYKINTLAMAAPADDRFTLDLDAVIDGKAMTAKVKTGTLRQLLNGLQQNLDADVTYDSQHVQLSANYSHHQQQHMLEGLALTYGQLVLNGDASFDISGAVPQVKATLKTRQIDSGWFNDDAQAGSSGTSKAKTARTPLFSRNPLPWNMLTIANADLRLDAGQLLQRGQPWGPGHVQARLQNGVLDGTLIVQPPGAAQPVTVTFAGNTARRLTLDLNAPALEPALWARFLGDDPFIASTAKIALNVSGQGASLHDIVDSSKGAVRFEAQPGKLRPAALPNTVRRVLDAVFTPARMNEAALGCLQASFTLQNGVLQSNGVGADSNIFSLSGEGQVNLPAENIKMRFVAVPKLASISNLRIPVTIDGDLHAPGFGADSVATAGQVAGKVAGAVLGARFGDFAGKAVDQATLQLVRLPPNPCVITATEEPDLDPATVRQNVKDLLPPDLVQDVEQARQKTLDFIANPLEKLRGKKNAKETGAVPAPAPVEPAVPAAPEPPPAAVIEQPAAPPAAEPAAPAVEVTPAP